MRILSLQAFIFGLLALALLSPLVAAQCQFTSAPNIDGQYGRVEYYGACTSSYKVELLWDGVSDATAMDVCISDVSLSSATAFTNCNIYRTGNPSTEDTSLTLPTGANTYYLAVNSSNCIGWTLYSTTIDVSEPLAPTVPQTNFTAFTSGSCTTRSFELFWDSFFEPMDVYINGGVYKYLYCIGSSVGACNVAGWNITAINGTDPYVNWVPPQGQNGPFYLSVNATNCKGSVVKNFGNAFSLEQLTGPEVTVNTTLSLADQIVSNCKVQAVLSYSGFSYPDGTTKLPDQYEICVDYPSTYNCSVHHNTDVPSSPLSYTVPNLEGNTTYKFAVRAFDTCKELIPASGWKNITNTTQPISSAPIDTSMANMDFESPGAINDTCDVQQTLKWRLFFYPGKEIQFLEKFDVCLGTSENTCDTYHGIVNNTDNVVFSSLKAGATYYASIAAINGCGVSSPRVNKTLLTVPTEVPGARYASASVASSLNDSCNFVSTLTWSNFTESDSNPTPYSLAQYEVCALPSGQPACTDSDWILTSSTSHSFPDLPEGNYTFYVRARNCRGPSDAISTVGYLYGQVAPDATNAFVNMAVVDPCASSKVMTIHFGGFSGYVSRYTYCVGSTTSQCDIVSATTTVSPTVTFNFTQPKTYYVTVFASNCIGDSANAHGSLTVSESSGGGDASNAYLSLDVSLDATTCKYAINALWGNFSQPVNNYVVCFTENAVTGTVTCPAASETTLTSATQQFTNLEGGKSYYVSVKSNSCLGTSSPIGDYVTLPVVTAPTAGQVVTTASIDQSASGTAACTASIDGKVIGIFDHGTKFSGSLYYCISTSVSSPPNCDVTGWTSIASDSFTAYNIPVGQTYYVHVNASGCAGSRTITSSAVVVPASAVPSVENADIQFYFTGLDGGCRKDAYVTWSGITDGSATFNGEYTYCWGTTPGACDKQAERTVLGNSGELKNLRAADFGQVYYLTVYATNCQGQSQKFTKAIPIPAEATHVDNSNAVIESSLSVSAYGCGIVLGASWYGFKVLGDDFTGTYEYCLTSSVSECNIRLWYPTGNAYFEDVDVTSQVGSTIFIKVRPVKPCANVSEEYIVSDPIAIVKTADASGATVTAVAVNSCQDQREITVSWSNFTGLVGAYEVCVGLPQTALAQCVTLPSNYSSYTFFGLAPDTRYQVSVRANATCGDQTSIIYADVTTSQSPISSNGASTSAQVVALSNCEFALSVASSGFNTHTETFEYDLCVGRNTITGDGATDARCQITGKPYSSSGFEEFVLDNQYFFDRTYRARAAASVCSDLKSNYTYSSIVSVPAPSAVSTASASVTLTGEAYGYCGYTFTPSWTGFKVGSSDFAGTFQYCIGTSAGACDLIGWRDATGSKGIITSAVIADTTFYASVKAQNCFGTTDAVVSQPLLVSSSEVGCCSFAPQATGATASITVSEAKCDAAQSNTPRAILSFSGVSGDIRKFKYCLSTDGTNCDVADYTEASVNSASKMDVALGNRLPAGTSKDYYIIGSVGNCAGYASASAKTLISGRPAGLGIDESKVNTDGCKATFTVPSINGTSYEYCVGTSANTCDIIGWTAIAAGQHSIDKGDFELADGAQYHVSVRNKNCFGIGSQSSFAVATCASEETLNAAPLASVSVGLQVAVLALALLMALASLF